MWIPTNNWMHSGGYINTQKSDTKHATVSCRIFFLFKHAIHPEDNTHTFTTLTAVIQTFNLTRVLFYQTQSVNKVTDSQPGSTTDLSIRIVSGVSYLCAASYWSFHLKVTEKSAQVKLLLPILNSQRKFLAFPLSAPPIVNIKANLLGQQEPAQSIVRNKYHLQYLEEWFRYDKQGNWYLITLPVGKTWPFLITALQFFITTALPYLCAFWACTTRVWRNMRNFFLQ